MREPNEERLREQDEDKLPTIKTDTLKNVAIIGSIAFAAFMLGLVPMWLSSRSQEIERTAAETSLRASTMQNDLATAALLARRGEFEPARQKASMFFTEMRAESERTKGAFNETNIEAVRSMLAQRDEIITLLARNDPRSAESLGDLYFNVLQLNAAPALE